MKPTINLITYTLMSILSFKVFGMEGTPKPIQKEEPIVESDKILLSFDIKERYNPHTLQLLVRDSSEAEYNLLHECCNPTNASRIPNLLTTADIKKETINKPFTLLIKETHKENRSIGQIGITEDTILGVLFVAKQLKITADTKNKQLPDDSQELIKKISLTPIEIDIMYTLLQQGAKDRLRFEDSLNLSFYMRTTNL